VIQEIARKRDLKKRMKQKRQEFYLKKVAVEAPEPVVKPIAQPITEVQAFKFQTDRRKKAITIGSQGVPVVKRAEKVLGKRRVLT
jgi:carbamate kinase